MHKINDKNYILCLETTSPICGVSIVCDNKILYESNLDKGLNHSVTLFGNIDTALKKTKLTMRDIDVIKVSNGPGSFTGLRIGIAAALGLSEPYNTNIEYVDTLDSLAYNIGNKTCRNKIIKKQSGSSIMESNIKQSYINKHFIVSMIDARVDRVYISLYNSDTLEKLSNDSIVTIDELCETLNKYFTNKNIKFSFVGSGAVNYKKSFKDKLRINYKIFDKVSNLCASSLAFTKGIISKVPFTNYLLASKAERERKQ